MFRSVVIAHDGSLCIEGTLGWLRPLLGRGHAQVELFGRHADTTVTDLDSRQHLDELAAKLREAGAEVTVHDRGDDLLASTPHRLVVCHERELALKLLRETSASLFFTPEGVSPHVPKRVLLALDGSRYAEEIIPLLAPFAAAFRPEVVLLRVMPDEEPTIGAMLAHPQTIATRPRALRSLDRAQALLTGLGVSVRTHTADRGAIPARILETAQAQGVDLIAASTHGHHKVARWLFGSCTDALVQESMIPVLVRNTRD